MSRQLAWMLVLAGTFGIALVPDTASAQRARVAIVEIMPADAQIAVGQQQVFLASAYDRDNSPVATATFIFTSSNRNVASVDVNGIATGVSSGTVIITARTGTGPSAKSATATLTVVSPAPASVTAQAAPGGAPPAMVAPGGDCSSASIGALNQNRRCYDQRPVPLAPLLAVPPEGCPDSVTPASVLVQVSSQGEVADVRPLRGSSNCAAFAAAASAVLRDLAFAPALLRGMAVAAWITVVVRPAPPGLRDGPKRSPGP